MSQINQVVTPNNGQDIFSPIIFEYQWSDNSCTFVDVDGNAAIQISFEFDSILDVGDSIRIINGTYAGIYNVILKTEIIAGVLIQLNLNTLFIGNSSVTGSSLFAPNTLVDFQLLAGYFEGVEALIKPWIITDEIRVSTNSQGRYRFDVSGFLKSRFTITEPLEGANVPISIRYQVRVKTNTAIPNDSTAITAYYGLEDLTIPQQEGSEAVGERPILFFGNAPTLYSLALDKGIIHNFVSNPNQPSQTTSGSVVSLNLLSCEPKELTWIGTEPTAGFTVTPALPDWISATSEGNNIKVILNPCTGGAGDYTSNDYNPFDYLVGGQLNSVTGCFTFDFEYFILNVCVTPVSELVQVCSDRSLSFAWLNQRGGFSSLSINCRYIEGRDFGSDTTVLGSDGNLKRVEFENVYDTYEVTGGVLSKNQIDLLSSLRSSIQAYLYSENTEAFDIPIVLDRQSYATYGNRFNQSETRFSFKFKVSKQIVIQSQ